MYTVEEINQIVREASEKAMNVEKNKGFNWEMRSKLFGEENIKERPEYYPGYLGVVEDYEAIRVHADKKCFPYSLFAKRAPNQTEQAARWMRENYKNVTNPIFIDFLNTVLRCTHDQNWSITYGNDSDVIAQSGDTFQKYVEEGIYHYGSLESFFKQVMFSLQLQDAMGVVAVKPREIPTVTNEQGEVMVSSTELVSPQPFYYTCMQVVSNSDKYFLIELSERSDVLYGNAIKRIGRVYEFYDEQAIYICRQTGKYIENTFEISVYYQHNIGKIPVTRFGGVPFIHEGTTIYRSPFLFATDVLDLVAQNAAYLQASIAKCVFPATIMLGDICQFEDQYGHKCEGGYIKGYADQNDPNSYFNKSCPSCHGSGLISRLGPLETMLIRPEVRGQNDSESRSMSQKPLEYVSPEVTSLEFLMQKINEDLEKARQILHLTTSNSNVKGSEDLTATGKVLDQKALFAFVLPIAGRAFSNFEYVINIIGLMRYGSNFVAPTIKPPQTFDIGTEQDILNTIARMIDAGVPGVLIQAEIFNYLKSVFYTDSKTSSIYSLMVSTDRLLVMSADDIAFRHAKGLADSWEVILHDSFLSIVDNLIKANPDFLSLDVLEQQRQVIEKAKEIAESIDEDDEDEPMRLEQMGREAGTPTDDDEDRED